MIRPQLLDRPVTEKPSTGEATSNWLAHSLGWLFLLICCIPFFAYCYLIQAVGANNVSNDYLSFIPLIEPIFTGGYDWRQFLTDTFMGTHCELVGMLTHLGVAMFMSWDARSELYVGLGIAMVRGLLLCGLLSEPDDGKWKYLLYGGVMALVFSFSQASLYLYGETSFPIGFCLLGFSIGLFAIVKFHQRPSVAIPLMLFGGLLSSLSWGNFLPCWLSLLLALVLFKYKRKIDYATWLTGILASLGLYSYIRIREFSAATSSIAPAALYNWHLWLNLIGRPFCNDVAVLLLLLRFSSITGLFAVLATVFSAALLFWQKQIGSRAKASITLAVYAMLSCWLISVFRNVIAPWYTAIGMIMWIGLWGLTISLLKAARRRQRANPGAILEKLTLIVGISIALIIVGVYVFTNRTYEDKQFFLQTRAPVSEATVRNFRTAPTYCEQYVFQWGDGNYRYLEQLAKPLEKYKLSAFSNQQQWSLQGDFPLDNVRVIDNNATPPVSWLDSMQLLDTTKSTDRNDWRSYKHLNLGLSSGSQVKWTLDLPSDLQSATLITAFGLSSPSVNEKETDQNVTQLTITGQQTIPSKDSFEPLWTQAALVHSGRWYPVQIPLSKYKGNRLTLKFSCRSTKGNQTRLALFQYPHVDVVLAPASQTPRTAEAKVFSAKPVLDEFPIDPSIKPSNTDLSPDMVQETPNDYCFPSITSNFWRNQIFTENELIVNGTAQGMRDKSSPLLCSKNQLDIHLRQYSHLQVEAQTQMPLRDCRSLFIVFNFADGLTYRFSLPLLPDGQMHKYSYDLKLLDSDINRTLDQIFFRPVNQNGEPLSSTIRIKSVRLIRKRVDNRLIDFSPLATSARVWPLLGRQSRTP